MRRALLCLALLGVLLSGSAVKAALPAEAASRTYSYGPHLRQTVTVYGTGGPGLMILHGGYWAHDSDWSGWARDFAARGYVVFDVDYRLNSDAPWPAQRDDALAALDWVRQHRAEFRVRGARPVLLGSSAGGQIAAGIGTYGAGRARVAGVVALSPVASPYRAWVDGGRAAASAERRKLRVEAGRLAGCDPDLAGPRCRAQWQDMAALSHASGTNDAPMLMVHSYLDFVPAEHSFELVRAERSAGMRGADLKLTLVPGKAHGGQLLRRPGVAAEVRGWVHRIAGRR